MGSFFTKEVDVGIPKAVPLKITGESHMRRVVVTGISASTPEEHKTAMYMLNRGVYGNVEESSTILYYYSHYQGTKDYCRKNFIDKPFPKETVYQMIKEIREVFWLDDPKYDIDLDEDYIYTIAGAKYNTKVKGLHGLEFYSVEGMLEYYTDYERDW